MCVMPDRALSCQGEAAAAVIVRHRVPVKEIEGDGGMDDQEVAPPVPSQHQLKLCLRCPKASACHLAGAGSGGIGLIHNRSISLLHLMPPGKSRQNGAGKIAHNEQICPRAKKKDFHSNAVSAIGEVFKQNAILRGE
jgi:hypothetical protein